MKAVGRVDPVTCDVTNAKKQLRLTVMWKKAQSWSKQLQTGFMRINNNQSILPN